MIGLRIWHNGRVSIYRVNEVGEWSCKRSLSAQSHWIDPLNFILVSLLELRSCVGAFTRMMMTMMTMMAMVTMVAVMVVVVTGLLLDNYCRVSGLTRVWVGIRSRCDGPLSWADIVVAVTVVVIVPGAAAVALSVSHLLLSL